MKRIVSQAKLVTIVVVFLENDRKKKGHKEFLRVSDRRLKKSWHE